MARRKRAAPGTKPLAEVDGEHDIGLTCGIFDEEHAKVLGGPLLAFAWAVRRQTSSNGALIGDRWWTYEQIATEIGCSSRSVRRWMNRLAETGYVELETKHHKGVRVRVLKTRKRTLV